MNFDIVVCGGGIAGAFASIAAARRGGNVLLCEKGGTLGGSITASQVGFILDAKNKDGLIREFIGELDKEMKKDAASIFETVDSASFFQIKKWFFDTYSELNKRTENRQKRIKAILADAEEKAAKRAEAANEAVSA